MSKENKNSDEAMQGMVGLVGFVIILPLLYFDVVDFFWTGLYLWIAIAAAGVGLIQYSEINKSKSNDILKNFDAAKKGKSTAKKPSKKDLDDDFDLPGYGAIIWKSSEGLPISFDYVNAEGECTERTIILRKLYKDSKTRFYLQGHCLLRKSSRTFVSDRMKNIYNQQGEIFEIKEFIDKIAGYRAYGTTKIQEK